MDNITEHTFDKIFLEAYAFYAKERIERIMLEPIVTAAFVKSIFAGWELGLKGYVLGNHLEKKYIEFPADWWQAFKDNFFPEWLLKHFPVIHRRIEISFDVLYPDFKIAIPDERMIWTQKIR